MKESENYNNPLVTRYASAEMNHVFSEYTKFTTWRKLWIELAKAEKELGLDISEKQIEEMKANAENLNLDVANEFEKKLRHDVMAHIHAFGEQCPVAKPIIHLGATSAYVGDNTDLIQMRNGLIILKSKLVNLMKNLRDFAIKYKDLPTLGFTHFQPAQLTTVGKRAALWLQDLAIDYEDIEYSISSMKFRGVKGTTGTQASFLELFEGNHEKVKELDNIVSSAFGFDKVFTITGQTYSRKMDSRIAAVLSGICQSLSKMSFDLRLLAHLKEIEEPFEKNQVGSSAMPYKRNPMRSERISSIARFVISLENSPATTHAVQWFERTLDDSANKRLSIPQMFLGTDSILKIAINVTSGLVVYPKVIRKHIDSELPFIATENILMNSVKKGGDRQELHEEIRKLSHQASKIIKEDGGDNTLIELISSSGKFKLSDSEMSKILDPSLYIGRAPQQVEEFIKNEIDPILEREKKNLGMKVELEV